MSAHDTLMAERRARIDAAHRFQAGRTALLLIDIQTAFLHPEALLSVPPAWDIVPSLQRALAAFRRRGMPVIFTTFVASPHVPTLRSTRTSAPASFSHLALSHLRHANKKDRHDKY